MSESPATPPKKSVQGEELQCLMDMPGVRSATHRIAWLSKPENGYTRTVTTRRAKIAGWKLGGRVDT